MIRLPETLSASKRVPRWRILSYFLFVFFGEKNLFTLNSGGRAYETTPTDAIWESVAFSLDRKQLENPFLFSDKTTIVYRKDVNICLKKRADEESIFALQIKTDLTSIRHGSLNADSYECCWLWNNLAWRKNENGIKSEVKNKS